MTAGSLPARGGGLARRLFRVGCRGHLALPQRTGQEQPWATGRLGSRKTVAPLPQPPAQHPKGLFLSEVSEQLAVCGPAWNGISPRMPGL